MYLAICSLFIQNGNPDEKKAVFVISTPLIGQTTATLRDIVQSSDFQYVVVVSTLCSAMHTLVQRGPMDDDMWAFHKLEDSLLDWMGNMVW